MFRLLTKRRMGRVLRKDTEETLSAVSDLSAAIQRQCAATVLEEISAAVLELEATPGPGPNRDAAIRRQLRRAQAARHRALANGATDESDPDWAAAALVESWLMANSGPLGRSLFDAIDPLIRGWIRAVLNDAEIDAALSNATATPNE